MLQAAVCDGGPLDAMSFGEDCLGSSKIDVSGREVVDALVIADVVIVHDEGIDLPFEISRQIVIVEQNAVLQGLVPASDRAVAGRVAGRFDRTRPMPVCARPSLRDGQSVHTPCAKCRTFWNPCRSCCIVAFIGSGFGRPHTGASD